MKKEEAIAAGYAAFQSGNYRNARDYLVGVKHVQAIHLLGLVEKASGNYRVAKAYLDQAAQLDPDNHEILNNQGLLARLMGELHVARDAFRAALELKPDFASAQLSLGRTLGDLGDNQAALVEFEDLLFKNGQSVAVCVAFAKVALNEKMIIEARAAIEAATRIAPEDSSVLYAQGVLKLETGETAAAAIVFQNLIATGWDRAETRYMMARIHLENGDLAAAQADAETAYRQVRTNEYLLLLADLYWMIGEKVAFYNLLSEAVKVPALTIAAIGLIRKSGRIKEALGELDQCASEIIYCAAGQSLRSALLLDLGDAQGAIVAGRAAIERDGNQEDNFHLVRALLSAGEANEALELIKTARTRYPQNQFWLAYEATALRLLNDARYDELIDYDRHVHTYDLPVPDGFKTLADFNEAFLALLDEMNPFVAHPLNQSLRGGGQAPHDLSVSSQPLLKSYFKALDQPIRDYMVKLGAYADHPSSARNTGQYKFSGGWSVRLSGGGHHVNHVHPRGWISSSYYVSVPNETTAGNSKAGWIKFGEPPIATKPTLSPEKWIQPRPGMVVLFPSFLWHGTEPIQDGSTRVTAPFDVVPIEESKARKHETGNLAS